MSLIPLGILAASGAGGGGSYESIATYTASGTITNFTFGSIPSSYQHLQIRFNGLYSTAGSSIYIQLNGDSNAANYAAHALYGTGSSAAATGSTNQYPWILGAQTGGVATYPSVGVTDILDYNAAKNKTVRSFSGADANGSGGVTLNSGVWLSTSGVTSIKVLSDYFLQAGSTFALYGIKGS